MPAGAAPGERRGRRAKGTPNKATVEFNRLVSQSKFVNALPPDFDPLDLMRAIYQDESLPFKIRIRAAKVAIPYETPKLRTIKVRPNHEREAETIRAAIEAGAPHTPRVQPKKASRTGRQTGARDTSTLAQIALYIQAEHRSPASAAAFLDTIEPPLTVNGRKTVLAMLNRDVTAAARTSRRRSDCRGAKAIAIAPPQFRRAA